MIYFFTLVWILYSAYRFDICKRKANKNVTYVLIGIWLTLMSALQYRMGADIIAYMGEYAIYDLNFSWDYISHFIMRRPGWVLLNQLCSLISEDFVCLKTVIAVFVNFAVFHFFKKHSNYPFISIFLYFIVLYFALSFNILRQSISFAIFLLSYDFLKKRKLIPYYLCCILALFFHDSAIVLFLLPLTRYIKLSREKIVLFAGVGVLFMILLLYMPGGIKSTIVDLASFVGDEKVDQNASNMGEIDTSGSFNIFGVIKYCLFFVFYCFVFNSPTTQKLRSENILNGLFVLFLSLYVLNVAFPILYRVCIYPQIIYILFASEFIGENTISININSVTKKTNSYLLLVLLFILVHFVPILTTKTMYLQYFPYSSIVDKSISVERERLYGDKENVIIY